MKSRTKAVQLTEAATRLHHATSGHGLQWGCINTSPPELGRSHIHSQGAREMSLTPAPWDGWAPAVPKRLLTSSSQSQWRRRCALKALFCCDSWYEQKQACLQVFARVKPLMLSHSSFQNCLGSSISCSFQLSVTVAYDLKPDVCFLSSGRFGLWLDADLYHGRSNSCSTFNNDILSKKEDFIIQDVEVWTFE